MRMLRRLAVAIAVVGLVAGTASAAAAATTAPPVRWAGTIRTANATFSTASAGWDAKTGAVRLNLVTGDLAPGTCVTVYYDWASWSHHDGRALRDCRPNDKVGFTFTDDSPTNFYGGPAKLGVCYGSNDKRGVCVRGIGTTYVTMDWTPWPDFSRTLPCDLSWVRRNASGTVSVFLDPHARSAHYTSARLC